MTDREKLKYLVGRAVYKAYRGGLEGVSFSELLAYMRIRAPLAKMVATRITPAKIFRIIRMSQGEIEEEFIQAIFDAVEELERDRILIITNESLILLSEKGHQLYYSGK